MTDETMSREEIARRVDELERTVAALKAGLADPAGPGPAAAEIDEDCGVPELPPREMAPDISGERASLIQYTARKWVNETTIHYCFFEDGPWGGKASEIDIVEEGFQHWRDVGLGLKFERVRTLDDAEVRIGFLPGDGYWSYVGTDVLKVGQRERTMNFGSDLAHDRRREHVAVHEIGHTMGFPHEHQNPNAGIVWDEPAVIARFSQPPNNWDESKIRHNILRKIPSGDVDGSNWDRDSVMHYSFPAGLIRVPEEFRENPLNPEIGLSEGDREQARFFYPEVKETHPEIRPFEAVKLDISAGQQCDFLIKPASTRTYALQTFGRTDSVMVLFEQIGDDHVYVKGDDDSGWDRNAMIRTRLYAGRTYVVRVRLYYQWASGLMALMLW